MLLKELIAELEREYGVEVWLYEDDNRCFSLEINRGDVELKPVWLVITDAEGYPVEGLSGDDYMNADADDITYHTKFGTYVYHGLPEDLSEFIIE